MKGRKTDASSDRIKLLLLTFILIGLLLRAYHIDFPPAGYHNMKETQYLTEAREFYFHGDYLNHKISWMEMGSPLNPDDSIQPPLLSWLILIFWKIAGIHLWLARIIIVVFSLGNIMLAYYICYELTGKKELSAYAAFFMAIMPVSVFFGRNIQPETPALFFMMLSAYYYLKWSKNLAPKYLAASLISFSVGGLFKLTFAIFAIPLLFVFPFGKLKDSAARKKLIGQISLIILSISPLLLWLLALKLTGGGQLLSYDRIYLFDAFRDTYWDNYYGFIKVFLLSNFTVFYVVLTFTGLLLCLRKRGTPFSRFCIGSALMVIPYFLLLSDYIRQHSYYQMPFLLLVSMASACALNRISAAVKNKNLKYAVIIGIIILTLPSVKQSIEEHYDRIFFGLDVAGETLNELSDEQDRVYIAGHVQTVGMLWNADRPGAFLPDTLEGLRSGENERHMRWIFAYDSAGILKLRENPQIWEYVRNNYSVREMGILRINDNERQLYQILERGGSINASKPDKSSLKLRQRYETSYGELEFYSLRSE